MYVRTPGLQTHATAAVVQDKWWTYVHFLNRLPNQFSVRQFDHIVTVMEANTPFTADQQRYVKALRQGREALGRNEVCEISHFAIVDQAITRAYIDDKVS
jgi:hypothetical protein